MMQGDHLRRVASSIHGIDLPCPSLVASQVMSRPLLPWQH
jgi:hypothetical protein